MCTLTSHFNLLTLSLHSVTADGKSISIAEKGANLRKELMANKIDVYSLGNKIKGNCGGAGKRLEYAVFM